MIISFLVYSIYNLYIFARDNWCNYDMMDPLTTHQIYCGNAWKFYFSQANKTEFEIDKIERALYILNWVALLALKIYYVRRMVRLDRRLDENMTEITDFTVEIRGLPSKLQAMDLIHYFDGRVLHSIDLGKDVTLVPKFANYVFSDTDDLITNQDLKIRRALKKYGEFKVKGMEIEKTEQKTIYFERVDQLEKNLEERYILPLAEFDTNVHSALNFTGKAFITFNTIIERNAVLDQMGISGIPKMFIKYLGVIPDFFDSLELGNHQSSENGGIEFFVLPARNPADILWENQGLSALNHTVRSLISATVTILLIGASFAAALGIKEWQSSVSKNWLASITLTLVLKIFNAIFSEATRYMIWFESPETKTQFNVLTFWRMSLVI